MFLFKRYGSEILSANASPEEISVDLATIERMVTMRTCKCDDASQQMNGIKNKFLEHAKFANMTSLPTIFCKAGDKRSKVESSYESESLVVR